jgi:hypothetical protein
MRTWNRGQKRVEWLFLFKIYQVPKCVGGFADRQPRVAVTVSSKQNGSGSYAIGRDLAELSFLCTRTCDSIDDRSRAVQSNLNQDHIRCFGHTNEKAKTSRRVSPYLPLLRPVHGNNCTGMDIIQSILLKYDLWSRSFPCSPEGILESEIKIRAPVWPQRCQPFGSRQPQKSVFNGQGGWVIKNPILLFPRKVEQQIKCPYRFPRLFSRGSCAKSIELVIACLDYQQFAE